MKKTKFYGHTLTERVTINNIKKTWEKTSLEQRRDWYGDSRFMAEAMSIATGYSLKQCAGVIAALSPLKSWEENIRIAWSFLKDEKIGHIGIFIEKAGRICALPTDSKDDESLILDILSGNKISAFYLNIVRRENNEVTIDRHALGLAVGKFIPNDYQGIGDSQYKFFQHCYNKAAKELGVSAQVLQSATWLYFRYNKNNFTTFKPKRKR